MINWKYCYKLYLNCKSIGSYYSTEEKCHTTSKNTTYYTKMLILRFYTQKKVAKHIREKLLIVKTNRNLLFDHGNREEISSL